MAAPFIVKLALWLAGVVHLLVAAGNLFLPAMLDYDANLSRLTPILRQIFRVHAAYLLAVTVGCGLLCFFCVDELAGATLLGRALSGFLGVFWLSRVGVQWFYYDADIKRARPWGNLVFTAAFLYLGILFIALCVLAPCYLSANAS